MNLNAHLPCLSPDDAGAPAPAAAPAASPATPAPAANVVDHDRYARVVAAKQGLEAQVADQRAQIDALAEKSATVDTLASQVEEWKGKAAEAATRFDRFKTLSAGLGTTDTEAIEAAEWAHSRLPAEGRPEIGAWVEGIKTDPTKAPKVLAPWLAPAPSTDPAIPAPKTPGPKPPNRGTQQTGAPAAVSAEQFRAAREKGVRSGDWSEFKALKKAGGYRGADA
jgi:hypothetical protein